MAEIDTIISDMNEAITFVENRGYGGVANTMSYAMELLKEQEKMLCKKQKDINKLQAGDCMLIIDKPMPSRCYDCPCQKDTEMEEPYCGIDGKEIDTDIFSTKPEWCPLKEIKVVK